MFKIKYIKQIKSFWYQVLIGHLKDCQEHESLYVNPDPI